MPRALIRLFAIKVLTNDLNQSINPSINESISQSINQPLICLHLAQTNKNQRPSQ